MMLNLLRLLPFLLPFYVVRFRLFGLPATLLEAYLLILFVAFLLIRGWKGLKDGWDRLGAWRFPVLAWGAVTLLSVFAAPNEWQGFGLWRAYVLEPLLVFLVLADVVRTEEARTQIRQSLFGIVISLGVYACIQFLTGWGIPHPWDVSIEAGRRATGPFPYPNALSLFVAPIGAWAFSRTLNAKRGMLDVAAWVAALGAILVARSDGGLIAFLAVAWLALFFHRAWRWLAVAVLISAALLVNSLPAIREPLIRELSFRSWSGHVRLVQWHEAWQMLCDHPAFGAGFGGYPTAIRPYHRATYIEIFQFPHNILLNFWSETGILGVLTFGWIIFIWIGNARRFTLHASRFTAVVPLLVILIHGLVDVPYFKNDLAILFWLMAFLATA